MDSLRRIVCVAALWLCFVVSGNLALAQDNSENIKIGSILILTGEGASVGTASERGIDMAIQDINAKGGVLGKPLAVIHQDDHGDPKTAIDGASGSLKSDGHRGFVKAHVLRKIVQGVPQ